MDILFYLVFFILLVPLIYLMIPAIASIRGPRPVSGPNQRSPSTQFIIAIPAHNEATVIKKTIERLKLLDYPSHMYSIHIVADHCSDKTAELATIAGANAHERNEGPRSGKGVALSWLFNKILAEEKCDAVVIIDADTLVEPQFLRIMDARLSQGYQVVQGQHIIVNPDDGWFPALTWAMFLVDNRFQNLGRTNLGWSSKHMGDSICFHVDVLRRTGWGEGLTEDYQLRQRLLLEGVRIFYEPRAIGYGEAALTWAQAKSQRARWLQGTHDASKQFFRTLLVEGLKRRNSALLDGALQAYFPSYSTLTLLNVLALFTYLFVKVVFHLEISWTFVGLWLGVIAILFIYPLFGLTLERAPIKAYLAILTGPVFILWRSWLALSSRLGMRKVTWIRTAHRGMK